MVSEENPADKSKFSGAINNPIFWASAAVALSLLGLYGAWYWENRNRIEDRSEVFLRFTSAPDTVASGSAAHFVLQVTGPENDPRPHRPVHLTVSPLDNIAIVSVTGPGMQDSAVQSQTAWGYSDNSGNISLQVMANAPGFFQIAAADSLSASAEGTAVDFHAR